MTRTFMLYGLLFMSSAVLAQTDSKLEFRSTVDTNDGTFVIDISRSASDGHDLSIVCKDECKSARNYSEHNFNNPIYVMSPRDGSNRIVTLWTTGSAYRIEVYKLGQSKIEKVLTVGSKSAPEILFASDGTEKIGIQDGGKKNIYVWSHDAYVIENAVNK